MEIAAQLPQTAANANAYVYLFAIAVALAVATLLFVIAYIRLRVRTRDRGSDPAASSIVTQIETVRSEIQRLNELFVVPQTRGAIGETLLAELLSAWLPPKGFELQYGFATGTRVDAIVRLGDRIVPIDSKFPLEAYQRYRAAGSGALPADLRRAVGKHIDDIADRYIHPELGTLSFALMYIPSDRVYTDLFAARSSDLLSDALRRSVVPVGPSTLFLYLQTVAYGLRGLAIPADTQRLVEQLDRLHTELDRLAKQFRVAGGHLRNLTKAFDESSVALDRALLRSERLTGRDDADDAG